MVKQFALGIQHFFMAFGFVSKHRLFKYYLIPIALALVLYFFLIGILFNIAWDVISTIVPDSQKAAKDLSFSDMSASQIIQYAVSHGLARAFLWILALTLGLKFSKYIVLILLSPLFAILSEKVEELETGKTYPFDLEQFIKDVFRGIFIALRNFLVEMMFLAGFGILGLLTPVLVPIYSVILIGVSAYYFGFSTMDYTFERRRLSIKDSVKSIRKLRGFTLGIGLMYWVMDNIPILGITIGPINAVIGSSTGILAIESKQNNE
jgi:CysZ protein